MKKKRKSTAAPLIACICAAVLLVGGYVGLCAWTSGHILPHSEAAGVEIGGLSRDDAAEKLAEAAARYQGETVMLACGQTRVLCELDQAGLAFDTEGIIGQFSADNDSFLARGISWVGAMFGETAQAQDPLVFENQVYFDGLLSEFTNAFSQPVVQHDIQVEDTYVLFTRGQAGMALETQSVEAGLLEQLAKNNLDDYVMEPQITQPDEPDFESLSRQLYVEPSDAFMSAETYEITPSVTGVSLDPAAAQALYERTEPGESCELPLQLTEPNVTTDQLRASLFGDLLGEVTSKISGSSGRISNVGLAASMCDGTILLPDEIFSYWNAIAPCSASQGFQSAPSYLNGLTVDVIGGGVCQVSSSIYYASLLSNLEIVQRRNHSFAVGYLPEGADATVSGGNPDFQFKNNTPYPIKIVATKSGQYLTVQIWGTKTDDTYVKMDFKYLSTTPYETVYKIDDSVPAGTTKTEVTPYTGYKVEAYRCIYDGDDQLISRTLESTNIYNKRDRVILVNSADAAKYGLAPESTPEPEETPAPETTPPEETPATETTPPPEETPATEVTPPPEETPATETTPPPEETPASETTPPPEDTSAPEEPPAQEAAPEPDTPPSAEGSEE